MQDRKQAVLDMIERLACKPGFTTAEEECYVLLADGLTVDEVAERLRVPRSTAGYRCRKARRKVDDAIIISAKLVAEFHVDRETKRIAKQVVRFFENGQTRKGLGNPRRPSQEPIADWMPVRVAAKLCGVTEQTVENWIADPKHPCAVESVEFHGRQQRCVSRHAVPILDCYTQGPSPLRGKLVTWEDLVRHDLAGLA